MCFEKNDDNNKEKLCIIRSNNIKQSKQDNNNILYINTQYDYEIQQLKNNFNSICD